VDFRSYSAEIADSLAAAAAQQLQDNAVHWPAHPAHPPAGVGPALPPVATVSSWL